MFRLAKEELEKLGAIITATEIYQQPGLWKEAYQLYFDQLEKIESFLKSIKENMTLFTLFLQVQGLLTLLGKVLPTTSTKSMT